MTNLEKIISTEWDVIVIGTGMGGATCGYQLAKSGKRVLFCEKGTSHLTNKNVIAGEYVEECYSLNETNKKSISNLYNNAGRWSNEIKERSGNKLSTYIPFAGTGTGGSSTLFGMVMQRFYPDDFSPGENFKDIPGVEIPQHWPVTYDDLKPYYKRIETLFNVSGEIDPLRKEHHDPIKPRKPIDKNDFARDLTNHFNDIGLHPYQPPLACDFVKDCMNCQGFICGKNCKNDSVKVFLKPAMEQFGATLIDECAVVKINSDADTIKSITCQRQNKTIELKAKIIILAAGALNTPSLLLNSKSKEWPDGLANQSGLVGKNLMRNFYDLYFVFPKKKESLLNSPKDIYLTDFYTKNENKLGIIQSFGHLSPEAVLKGLDNDIENSRFSFLLPILRKFYPFALKLITRMIKSSYILVSTMEDMPYLDNQIIPADDSGGKLTFDYKIHPYDKKRISQLRKKIKHILKPFKVFVLKQAEQNKNFIALACGTCRFGNNPNKSVLDKNNKAHNINNLYIVDSSFFPTNSGLNSAHTIAANALRVADIICSKRPVQCKKKEIPQEVF